MSQSALIAFENPAGTFDLYWSHNGADEFYLKPYLEDVVTGDRDRTLPNVEAKLPEGAESQRFNVAETLKQAIVPEPVRRNVPRSDVGDNLDFMAYEGFYLVTERAVELYYPMWTYPGIFIALREMFDLEVYDRTQTDSVSSGDIDSITPVATFSTDDYTVEQFSDIRYRSFIERHHLGLFQTIAGTVNNADDATDLQSSTLQQEEHVKITPKTTENLFESHRVGNGVLINFAWDDGEVSQRLRSTIHRAASLRVDIGLRLLSESGGIPTREQYERFERELVEHTYRQFGMYIYPESIQPYTSLLEDITRTYAPNERVLGSKYRVIDTDGQTALLKPIEQYGKTGVVDPSDLSSSDVQIVDIEQTANDFLEVAKLIENGDIVIAAIDDSEVPGKIESIQLFQKIPLELITVDTAPSVVQELYDEEIIPAEKNGGLPSVRTTLESEYETISDTSIPVGEVQVTHDPDDTVWNGLQFGEISEQVYGRFQFTAEQPHEVLLCNPKSEPFWFGFFFDTPMTGCARYWRREFGCDYDALTLVSSSVETDIGNEIMRETGEIFDILMSAKNGTLSPEPRTIETTFSGNRAAALEAAQRIVDEVETEAPIELYKEYIGEVDPLPNSDTQRHQVNIVIDGPVSEE